MTGHNSLNTRGRGVTILMAPDAHRRIRFGAGRLSGLLESLGFQVREEAFPADPRSYGEIAGEKLCIGLLEDPAICSLMEAELLLFHSRVPEKEEAFGIETCPGRLTVVTGAAPSGVLYGCLELARRIRQEGGIPRELAVYDEPAFSLRGPMIGLQRTVTEPPRLTYEYPITPGRFPWFYDRELWERYLDMMLEDRCNALYIWSGHPFASLVKVPDYPYALEVSEEEFALNRELFSWLTEACDKRGIWVVLKFYNIHIPLPFAEHHGLPVLQSSITPLVADYTFKSIVEFIKNYPRLGLMVCLGEALRGNKNKTEWFVKTIIPGVKEGLRQAGITEEPPLILRGHDCDPVEAMGEALPLYGNLYTMWKYNGEGLTTSRPRGNWQARHRELSRLGGEHIINVHILADLEPFRYAAPLFIQSCVRAGRDRLGGSGLHLYPLFYWDWPYAPDKTEPRLFQIDRDRIWYEAWMRYAWNPDRDGESERLYWINRFAGLYRVSLQCGEALFDAMESAGQCAPRILGRIGITEGNRQTMSLGMTMSQLTNVMKYRPNLELWYSVASKGEQPEDYVRNKIEGKPHTGETPPGMIGEVMYFARRARDAMSRALELCGREDGELKRMASDTEALYELSLCYGKKLEAALNILEYRFTMKPDCSGNTALLEAALVPWEESLAAYRRLTSLTEKTYLYANSMQTPQRKIPFPGGGLYRHFRDCLPEYERELANFKKHLGELKAGILPRAPGDDGSIGPYPQAEFKVLSPGCEAYTLEPGARVFTEEQYKIKALAPELAGLRGVRFSLGAAIGGRAEIKLELARDSRILIGYMAVPPAAPGGRRGSVEWLALPELETNTHADLRGGLEPVLLAAMRVSGCPPVNIHAPRYEKGVHTLSLGLGGFIIAGVIPDGELKKRNAGLEGEGFDTLDWLYE
ncbi:MAG: hypothetical protein LBP43_02020 [Treponema sp.]|nr:hypothetical protein [Treponema sp.]